MCRCIQFLVIFCASLFVITCAPLAEARSESQQPTAHQQPLKGQASQRSNRRQIRVLEHRIQDIGLKTSLSLRLIVGSVAEEAKLRRILNEEFEKARALRGFKYRDRLNQIFIYLYESGEARKISGANWLAMLYWDSFDGKVKQPSISIKQ